MACRAPKFRQALALVAALALGGCTETRYVAYDDKPRVKSEGEEVADLLDRKVEFRVDRSFYDRPPECVAVMPFMVNNKPTTDSSIIEEALERHLATRFTRVIGPAERNQLARRMVFDLANPGDYRSFAREARCPFVIASKPWQSSDTYALFWSQTRIGLDVTMIRAEDETVVWQARHVSSRSEGGLPLSFFAAPLNLLSANRFHNDADRRPSIADDTVRRMVATLPDLRTAMRRY